VLAVTFHLLHVGVIRLLLYLHLDRIVSILILPIPSGQILGIVPILYWYYRYQVVKYLVSYRFYICWYRPSLCTIRI